MARPRKVTNQLQSIEECDAAMYRLLLSTLTHERLVVGRDKHMTSVVKLFEPDICKAAAEIADETARLQHYYLTHIKEIEADGKKSLKLTFGTIGRRLSPAALKLTGKSWTWEAAREALKAKFGTRYLTTKEPELNKDLVKQEIASDDLADYGLKLHQEEKFYADLDRPEAGAAV